LTANELLALLGRAWPRLLIYPGGLAAFALVWLLERANRSPAVPRRVVDRGSRIEDRGSRIEDRDPRSSILGSSAIVLPWLGLALLPLPHAAAIGRSTDLVAVLALLEWPLLLTIAAELRGRGAAERAVRRIAAALNSYPPLILAALVMASASGSLDVAALARPPAGDMPAPGALLHWAGAVAWALALAPALGLGPFAAGMPAANALRIGMRLRALGLVALGALPWFPVVAGPDDSGFGGAGPALLLLPIPPLLIAALLWVYGRLTAAHQPRRWARVYLAFDAALLLVLMWAAYAALQARLA
jgi:hypothetical protein